MADDEFDTAARTVLHRLVRRLTQMDDDRDADPGDLLDQMHTVLTSALADVESLLSEEPMCEGCGSHHTDLVTVADEPGGLLCPTCRSYVATDEQTATAGRLIDEIRAASGRQQPDAGLLALIHRHGDRKTTGADIAELRAMLAACRADRAMQRSTPTED